MLALAGVLVGLVVVRLPGRGGHIAAAAVGAGETAPIDLPGVVLAAALTLIMGAVLGPEAPLIALGGALAILAARRTRLASSPQGVALIAAAGSAAAISTIFGNPLVAAILMLEVVGSRAARCPCAAAPSGVQRGRRADLHRAR